nr:hypothetical protein [Eubacterium sp.]
MEKENEVVTEQVTEQVSEDVSKKKQKELKDPRIKMHIRTKINILLIVFAVILSAGTVMAGRDVYRNAITKRYDEIAYQLARTVNGFFTENEIKTYAEALDKYSKGQLSDDEVAIITSSDRYKEVFELVKNTRKEFDANDIFLCVVDLDIM